jgi:hypothetical protein
MQPQPPLLLKAEARRTRPPRRWPGWGRRSTLGVHSISRVHASPPSLRHAPASLWQRLMFWLMAPAPHEAAPPLNRLPQVRNDFIATIQDANGPAAEGLRVRILAARSLRELWHLRSDVFRVVGLTHSQGEAERRVSLLTRHFPTRAPRSQFGGM